MFLDVIFTSVCPSLSKITQKFVDEFGSSNLLISGTCEQNGFTMMPFNKKKRLK